MKLKDLFNVFMGEKRWTVTIHDTCEGQDKYYCNEKDPLEVLESEEYKELAERKILGIEPVSVSLSDKPYLYISLW